jgi:hypothetical protein
MAWLISTATGNFSSSSTWAQAEAGSGAVAMITGTSTNMAAAGSISGKTFTITSGHVIDGVLLFIRQGATGSTGTLKVSLQLSGVDQASVTVNKTDLPPSTAEVAGATGASFWAPPVFFKFTSTATGDGTANWSVTLTTTGTNTITIANNSVTSGDWMRILRTTTTAAPAAGNDLCVTGSLTGAGTNSAITVTMDNTTSATTFGSGAVQNASTAPSGMIVANYGTLTYGTAASTNYYYRVNGDVFIFYNGTFAIGDPSGTSIPGTSTAVLEFVLNTTSGDFGLHNINGTYKHGGSPRTTGKNVVACKLTADFGTQPATVNNGGFFQFTASNVTVTGPNFNTGSPDPSGTNLRSCAVTDNATNTNHYCYINPYAATTGTILAQVWLKQGTGTHNRYVRLVVAAGGASANPTNGFYADIDLQLGTIGTCTALGNGTATSSSISAAIGGGYVCTIIGIASSSSTSPYMNIVACSAAGTISYAGDSTQNFTYYGASFYYASSLPFTASVDTDTGWLSGDVIAIASTSQAINESEVLVLNGNATSSSITFSYSPEVLHVGGTSVPNLYAELILLTRNVTIRASTTTYASFVYHSGQSVVNAQWGSVVNCGLNAVGKYGVTFDTATTNIPGAKTWSYNSFYGGNLGSSLYTYSTGNYLGALSYTYNVAMDNCSFSTGIINALSDHLWVLDHCWHFQWAVNATGWNFSDVGGTATNLTAIGATNLGAGIVINGGQNGVYGTFDHLTARCSQSSGIIPHTGYGSPNKITNITAIRNASYGINLQNNGSNICDFIIDGVTAFGNGTANFGMVNNYAVNNLTIRNANMNADPTYQTPENFAFIPTNNNQNQFDDMYLDNVVTTTAVGGGVLATHDFQFGTSTTSVASYQITARNCNFGSSLYNSKVNFSLTSYLASEKFGQTSGDHRCEMANGQSKTDSAIYNNASPSQRLTPSNASGKLQSAPLGKGIIVPVPNGTAKTVSVYVRESVGTDLGAAETWNASDKSANITLSGGNLIATNSGSVDASVRGAVGRNYGKLYLEFVAGATWTGVDTCIGLALATATLSSFGSGNAVNGIAVYLSGNGSFNGSASQFTMGTGPTAGQTVCLCIDYFRQVFYARVNNGTWNNGAGGASPDTNVGGYSFGSFFGSALLYPIFCTNGNGTSGTLNTGGSAFNYSIPAGYQAWDNGGAYNGNPPRLIQRANPAIGQNSDVVLTTFGGSAGTWTKLSAATSTPTDDGAFELIVDCDGTVGWVNVDDWAAQ